jgi:transcription initiation factor TFIIE subunit alpha
MAFTPKDIDLKSSLVKEYLSTIVGEASVRIALLCAKKESSPDELSKKTGMKISHVRSHLNRMHTHSLVSYTKRINEGNNWVTYSWKLNVSKLLKAVRDSYAHKVENVNHQLELERNSLFFSCTQGCRRLLLEEAMEHDFRCPTCSGELRNIDNTDSIEKIEKIRCALLA